MKILSIHSVGICVSERCFVAKRFFPLLVSVLFLIPNLSAQSTWVSQVERYVGQSGQNLIVRSTSPTSAIMCSKTMQWTGEHTFRHRSLTGGTKGFKCDLSALLTDSVNTFVVKDMYVLDSVCYFCGYISVKWGEPMYNPQGEIINSGWYQNGVVGLFNISDFNFSNVNLQLLRINEVDSLTHLVVQNDNPSIGPLIMAVGRTSLNNHTSCVVELQHPSGLSSLNNWTKRIVQPQCVEDDEYMTDIILTDSYVEVVSKLPYRGEEEDPNHYIFRLHQTRRDGFYVMSANSGLPATVAQYSVQETAMLYGMHHEDEPISLCSMGDDQFCVTYGSEIGGTGNGDLIVFRMNGSQTMERAFWSYPTYMHIHVRDVAYLKDQDLVAILSTDDNDYPGGIVWILDMDVADYYDPMYWQGNRLWSIDCMLGQKVIAGGTYVNNTMFQTFYDPVSSSLYYYESLCFDTYYDSFEQFPVSEPTILECQWYVLKEGTKLYPIFRIPVQDFSSISDCLIEEEGH